MPGAQRRLVGSAQGAECENGSIEDFVQGRVRQEEYQRYFSEVHRLFEKRKAAMDPRKDARLSFTTCMGYQPGGIAMPAWKAVFFNPKTDAEVVRQIIRSIEEV